jgi:predicted DNA-binding protein with PD1-like motif
VTCLAFAAQQRLSAASFKGVGEPSGTLSEQVELLSLIGDVVLSAFVRPTCEVVLTENPGELQKLVRPDLGLALIQP